MISCVLAPVIVQNIYNLFFTHPGRQLFWEDIESIAITFFLLVIMAYDSAKKTSKIEAKKL
jgi:K+-sensing histidine kinase KdpD